jgi:transcriptional regulator with XRE-family HTH domain
VAQRFRQELARFIRAKRGKMTFAQFSRKTGLSASTLQRLEVGDQNITIDTLERLLGRLGKELGNLFHE